MLVLQKISRGMQFHCLKRLSSSSMTVTAKVTADPVENEVKKTANSKPMVAAAFASLKDDIPNISLNISAEPNEKHLKLIDEKIINAKSVSTLLAITDGSNKLTRKQALKIVSILAEWSTINRAKLSDFENDNRFLKLCRILGRPIPKNLQNLKEGKPASFKTDDLNTVLGIAGDDEAAKLISSISLPQMIKVISNLAQKKRRSTPLLRSLAFNISSSTEQLDLKQCADVLYAIASLNFPDHVLTAKVCADIQSTIASNKDKSAVVGSILTSLGLLKYRDLDVLELLSKWVVTHSDICRTQDISALFLTLATLNYNLQDVEDIRNRVVSGLREVDFPKKSDWLNFVWSLTLLKLAETNHIDSILCERFLNQIEEAKELTPNSQKKILNINAYANTIKKYQGSLLNPNSPIFSVPLAHCKSKQVLLNATLDALKSLLSSGTHVKSLVDTKMGFLIDVQCMFDSRGNPLPLEKQQQDAIKVAIMVVDFHDVCHGLNRSVSGLTNFSFEMLEKSDYKVLPVLYNEFNTSDKILKRVQYLERRLKDIISHKN